MPTKFTAEIKKQLGYYVYRLIDPRNGETFYIGKGKDNRVFDHASGNIREEEEGQDSEKLKRIREIKLSNFEVGHVIHRHGLSNSTALEVEAALLDAYPSTTNIAGGHDSGERGARHAQEIIQEFSAKEAVFRHNVIAIKINRSATEKSVYNAVRYAWKLDKNRAEKSSYVLAVINGLIVGVFEPEAWFPATPEFFPAYEQTRHGRIGFVGKEAPNNIANLYLGKRLPAKYRKRGAAAPARYITSSK